MKPSNMIHLTIKSTGEDIILPTPNDESLDIKSMNEDIYIPERSNVITDFSIIGKNQEKRIYKIDVGNISPEEAETYVKKISDLVKKPLVDPETGNIDLKYEYDFTAENLKLDYNMDVVNNPERKSWFDKLKNFLWK